jgi:hypothetical protein
VDSEVGCALQFFFYHYRKTLVDQNTSSLEGQCNLREQTAQTSKARHNTDATSRLSCDVNDDVWDETVLAPEAPELSTNGPIFTVTWPAVATIVVIESILHSMLLAGEMAEPVVIVVWRAGSSTNQPPLFHRLLLALVFLTTICLAFGGGLQAELIPNGIPNPGEDCAGLNKTGNASVGSTLCQEAGAWGAVYQPNWEGRQRRR